MRTRSLLAVLLSFALWEPRSASAQSLTVAGDLSVTGDADIKGNSFSLGSWLENASPFGFNSKFNESSDHASSWVTFTQTKASGYWYWMQGGDATGNGVVQMVLGADGSLCLFNSDGDVGASLYPQGGSYNYWAGSLYSNGNDNQMPSQTISGSASVLTTGLGDARYLLRGTGPGTLLGNSATASGSEGTAIGNHSNANGLAATSVGNNTVATGMISTAVGHTASATGDYSTAVGLGTVASGSGAVALGINSRATETYAVAVGYGASATAWLSSAYGNGSVASSTGATALGNGAVASGYESSALGMQSTSSNNWSLTLGCFSTASGERSSSLGISSAATGDHSVSLGEASGAGGWSAASLGYNSSAGGVGASSLGTYSNASGTYSTALSYASVASGDYSVAAGRTAATSLFQTAIGSYGLPGGNATTWVATDDLFTVGNGQAPNTPSNAFTVKKNGNVMVQGVITAAVGGDLAMGEFTAHPAQ